MKTLKSNPRITYRSATAGDLEDFWGEYPPVSVRAVAFFLDGKIVGIGGWKMEGGSFVLFSEIKDGVKVEKATIFRCARIVMDMAAENKCPMHAATDNPRFLESLGFQPFDTVTNAKEFFVWQC